MTDSVEVRPRYTEPGASRIEQPEINDQSAPVPAQTRAAPGTSTARGLFTSMYENKIIVLIIVVAILIIGIIAYVVFKKPDESEEKPKAKPINDATAQTNSEPASTLAPANTPATAPAAKTAPRMDKNNLVNLLAKSKSAGAKATQPEPEKPADEQPAANEAVAMDDGSKTEDEIMQLMEDEPAEDEHVVNDLTADQPEVDNSEQTEDCGTPENSADDSQNTSTVKSQSASCTAMLPMGRQCRNKAGVNGKCQRHQG